MALYSYRKSLPSDPGTAPGGIYADPDEVVITPTPTGKDRLTIGKLLSGIKNDIVHLVVVSKFAGFIIPLLLIIFGINIIFNQVWPEVEQHVKQVLGMYNEETTALVEGDYIERAQYLSNPGSSYFKSISDSVSSTGILQNDPVSNTFSGKFSLTIPSLDLTNLPVTANVDSSNETSYQFALNHGLAHFKGTGLPISRINNNIVIYGHSSSGDYYERTKDVAGAFSRLNKIKIGDIVTVKINNVEYNFRITKTKIVYPDETDIITGTTNKKTLTLFTCFPNGNSAQRFVAIGIPVDTAN